MKRSIRWFDYITINIYWFSLTTRSQVLSPLVIPLLVQQFMGEESKGTYVGNMRLWALMAAVLFQALMGMLSDRSTAKMGRRRPFIIAGTLGEIALFVLIGFTAGMQGAGGYRFLFLLYTLSMISSNTAHGAAQGLIPDLVPEEKRGRFSGVKALMELPLPLIFVSFVIGKMISNGNLWGGLFTLIAVMLVGMLITLTVPEEPLKEKQEKLDWQPILRLLLMTAAFTAIILLSGFFVKQIMALGLNIFGAHNPALVIAIGLAGMVIAIWAGVWSSIAIGIGKRIEEQKSFTWWVINRLGFLTASTNLAGFMIYFLQERFTEYQGEKAAAPASMITMFVGVFILLSALPSGWLSDKVGTKKVIILSAVLATIGTLVVILAPSLTVIYVGGILIGAGIGFFYASNWALGTEIVPKNEAGRFLGISNLAGAGAGAVGAYIGGPIADQIGYTYLMGIYAILFILSILAILNVKTKEKA
jgi:MFS family permease